MPQEQTNSYLINYHYDVFVLNSGLPSLTTTKPTDLKRNASSMQYPYQNLQFQTKIYDLQSRGSSRMRLYL